MNSDKTDISALTSRPWERLAELARAEQWELLDEFIDSLPVGELPRALSALSEDLLGQVLTHLPPEHAADLMIELPEVQAASVIESLESPAAAAILHELPSNVQADLVTGLSQSDAEQILAEIDPVEAAEIRALSRYSFESAGGLMITEYLVYSEDATVGDVVDDLRSHAEEYRSYDVQYVYIQDAHQRLVGVLRLRDLLLADKTQPVKQLAISDPITVRDSDQLNELEDVFEEHGFFGVPVVDEQGRLLGVLRRSDVDEALADRADDTYRKSLGIVSEELRSMPVWLRSRRRLAWLSVNILLNVIAASVIAYYQDTLAAVIALAVFLPIISDMSGCSGNQAVAVSMRELALGVVNGRDVLRVWLKEISVGAINGLALGCLIALVAWLWKGNPYLGAVVGTALALNTMIAVSIGGSVPLILHRWGMDPALASGPILTTITDMCGFFIVLSLAAAVLPLLLA